MFDHPAINVVIGLIFIYLIYSLLASIILEILATSAGKRSRVLRYAIERMLEDGQGNNNNAISTIERGLIFFFEPIYGPFQRWQKNSVKKKEMPPMMIDYYYNLPGIKYLGEDKAFNRPAYLGAKDFAENFIALLLDGQDPSKTSADAIIATNLKRNEFVSYKPDTGSTPLDNSKEKNGASGQKNHSGVDLKNTGNKPFKFQDETLNYIEYLFNRSGRNAAIFQRKLEGWFNSTMDRTSGWYKRKSQANLLWIGLITSVFFNIDSIEITRRLSSNPELARKIAYIAEDYEKYKEIADRYRPASKGTARKNDVVGAATIPDDTTAVLPDSATIPLKKDEVAGKTAITTNVNDSLLAAEMWSYMDSLKITHNKLHEQALGLGWKEVDFSNKITPNQGWKKSIFLGWILSALAISLGAPFWFDMLNKIMKLRSTGVKPEKEENSGASS